MAREEYSNPPQAPLAFTATADTIARETARICASTNSLLDRLTASVTPEEATFETVMQPLAEDENQRIIASSIVSLYLKVSPDAALREASAEAEKQLGHFMIDCWTREDIFRLVDAVFQKNEPVDPESRKLLTEWHRKFIRNGMALASRADKEKLKEIQKRLSNITTEFSKNLDDEPDPVCWFTPEQLDGLPDDIMGELEAGTGEYDGRLKIVLKGRAFDKLAAFGKNPESRKKIFLRSRTKGEKNVPLFQEGVSLRQSAAQLLGYANHADFQLEEKMAKNYSAVMRLLEDLRERTLRHKVAELEQLFELKRAERASLGLPEEELLPWDQAYYTRIQSEQGFAVDHQKIAEYFPLHPTVASMVKIFGDLFGFVFVEITAEDRDRLSTTGKGADLIWHEDVMLYSVWNSPEEGGEFAGYLYLDLLARDGKYGGLQCYAVQLGFTQQDGRRNYPSTALFTSFPRPAKDKPALLTHKETTLLFHELGHGMHDLAGRSRYARFHGAETAGDFNEAPSQMLENWCWARAGLQRLSSHYQTGEPLPDEMIDTLLETKNVNAALTLLPQLRMCLFDMEIHSAGGPDGIDVAEVYLKYRDIILKGAEDKHGYATYRHLFNGYDAGMYSYLWSKVHAMDMFDTAFKKDPLDSTVGRRYRHMVLEKGATQDEMKTLVEFLGREPKSDAFFLNLGLD
ncbi:zincin [Thozetella sp. PMI_491]|nr:zincin [Thozetella sp. PMI_491]